MCEGVHGRRGGLPDGQNGKIWPLTGGRETCNMFQVENGVLQGGSGEKGE
jgi:hypothetical protein